MLTIREAAVLHDLEMARGRMGIFTSDDLLNAEFVDLMDEQRELFLNTAIERGEVYENPT